MTIQEAVDAAGSDDTVDVYPGVYREYVIIPHGDVTLRAQSGVTITGADPWTEWTAESGNVYRAVVPKEFFGTNILEEYFNPFAVKWGAKGFNYPAGHIFTCGNVYINNTELTQKWSEGDVSSTANSWIATVDEATGETTIKANFAGLNPTNPANSVEINNRMQGITAKWNSGNITIDGFTVIRQCGPKTIDFWMSSAKGMYGAISTHGGHHWIIRNCELFQNRGVAIEFGNGSHGTEILNGVPKLGEPKLYGYHKIYNNYVHHNGTNGMMAYRGPYTEIYYNRLVNNNSLDNGLMSEAYIKDVSNGWGINIHDNYFYSDQTLSIPTKPIWLDSECDGSIVRNNVIIDKNGMGFSDLDFETNAGWMLVANNIFYNVGLGMKTASHSYLVNNLFINESGVSGNSSIVWPSVTMAMMGSEGYDGYVRAMKLKKPGTLDYLGQTPTSRFETVNLFSRLEGNIFYGKGPEVAKGHIQVSNPPFGRDDPVQECTTAEYEANPGYTEVDWTPGTEPDFSGGTWNVAEHPEGTGWTGIIAWNAIKGTVGTSVQYYGNKVDYNVYYQGAAKIGTLSSERVDDEHSKVSAGGTCSISANDSSCTLFLNVDDSINTVATPMMTKDYLGKATAYAQEGVDFYPPSVDKDFHGKSRGSGGTTVPGPFADLKPGGNSYTLWPR
jgi:hypothetical protein